MSGYRLEFTGRDGLTGRVVLELRTDPKHARFAADFAHVPDIDGIVTVRDNDIPHPRQGYEIRTDGLWAEFYCETPSEHWTFGMEAFGLIVQSPDDEIGDRVPVGFDIEWEVGAGGPPAGTVHGELLVGRERFEIDGTGSLFELDETAQ